MQRCTQQRQHATYCTQRSDILRSAASSSMRSLAHELEAGHKAGGLLLILLVPARSARRRRALRLERPCASRLVGRWPSQLSRLGCVDVCAWLCHTCPRCGRAGCAPPRSSRRTRPAAAARPPGSGPASNAAPGPRHTGRRVSANQQSVRKVRVRVRARSRCHLETPPSPHLPLPPSPPPTLARSGLY